MTTSTASSVVICPKCRRRAMNAKLDVKDTPARAPEPGAIEVDVEVVLRCPGCGHETAERKAS